MKTLFTRIAVTASLALMFAGGALAADGHAHGNFHGLEVDKTDLVHDATHGAAHAVAEHGEHASSAGLPQLDPTWFANQLFWLTITFVTLYVIFSKKILPALSSTIEDRHERIQGDLAEAQKLKEQAEQVHEAYEEVLDEARTKSAALYTKAEDAIKSKTAKEMDTFRESSATKTKDAEKKIEKAKKAAMKDMDNIAAEIASKAAEKIVGIKTDVKQAKNVIDNINKKAA